VCVESQAVVDYLFNLCSRLLIYWHKNELYLTFLPSEANYIHGSVCLNVC
jgi:hypothetical protein